MHRVRMSLVSLFLVAGSHVGGAAENSACAVPSPIQSTRTKMPYPAISQRMGEKGTTHLAAIIGKDGALTDVAVAKSSGSKRLDDAAAAHIRAHYRWQPFAESCNLAAITVPITVDWILDHPITPFIMREADFPSGALQRGEQGTVIVTFRVDDEGVATDARVTGSSGYPELDAKTAEIFKSRIGEKLFAPWPAQYPTIQPWRTEYASAIWSLPASALASLKQKGVELVEVRAPAIVLRSIDGPRQ